MADFCGKCGNRIDPTTGLCPNCDKEKLNNEIQETVSNSILEEELLADKPQKVLKNKKGKKKSKKTKVLIAIICSICIVIGTVFCAFIFKGDDTSESDLPTYGDYNSFMEGFTDVKVTDEKSAIQAAASVGNVLGLTDAEKELKVVSVDKVDNDTFYRMQQYYNDIPVYGKSIVISADKKGNATALTSNYVPASDDISLTPTATQENLKNSVQTYLNNTSANFTVDNSNLVLYQNENSEYVLAYEMEVLGVRFLLDANTSEVLVATGLINPDMVDCKYIKNSDEATFKGIKLSQNEYMIGDEGAGHFVLNANYQPMVKRVDKDGEAIFYTIPQNSKAMTSADNYFGNNDKFATEEYAKAVYMLEILQSMAKYYNSLNKEQETSSVAVVNMDPSEGGAFGDYTYVEEVTKAKLPYKKEKIISILLGSEESKDIYGNLDSVGHEYMHGINYTHLKFDANESAAINEAYADIFGEILDAYIKNVAPNWYGSSRNIANPHENNGEERLYPVSLDELNEAENYLGEGDVTWYYTTPRRNQKETTDFSHFASTIISHAAYSMWNGIDGTEARKISADKLGKLFYKSLMFMQDNPTFSECRNAVELSARLMLKDENEENHLTEEQYKTVITAFENTGIENATFTYNYTVKNNFNLSVLSNKGTKNTAFNLQCLDVINNEVVIAIDEKNIIGSRLLELENGIYVLRVSDANSKGDTVRYINIKIKVDGSDSNAKDLVTVNTDFTDGVTILLDDTSPKVDNTENNTSSSNKPEENKETVNQPETSVQSKPTQSKPTQSEPKKNELTKDILVGKWNMKLSIDSYCNNFLKNGNVDSELIFELELFKELFSGAPFDATVVFRDDGTFDMIPNESIKDVFDDEYIEKNSNYELKGETLYFKVEEGESYGLNCEFNYTYDGTSFVLQKNVEGVNHPYTGAVFTKIEK